MTVEQDEPGQLRGARLGSGEPEDGSRRIDDPWPRRCPTPSARSAPRRTLDPVRHLIGRRAAWGGNPEKDALYLTVVPPQNDGTTVHRLTSAMSRSTGSGRSPSTTRTATSRRTRRTPTRSTTSPRRRSPTERSRSSSAAATARAQLPADHAGLELHSCGCTGRGRSSSTVRGPSRRPSRFRAPARRSRRSCGPAGRGGPARRLPVGSAR